MSNFIDSVTTIGHSEGDHEELKIQKGFLVYLALFMSGGGIVWGTISLYYGLFFQSVFPYSYVLISALNMGYFSFSKNIKLVRFIQVFISLSLPFMFQWSLGGFGSSGIIMLWAILALIASLSFQSIQTSLNWLWVYLFLTILSAFLDEELKSFTPEILPDDSIIFVVINIILISSMVFGLVVFFVKKYKDAEVLLETERDKLKKSFVFLRNSHEALKAAYNKIKSQNKDLESQIKKNVDQSSDENAQKLEEYEKILAEQKKILGEFESN